MKNLGRKPLFASVEEIEGKIENYKNYLKTNKKPPTIAGLAYYLGVDRSTLYNYEKKSDFFDTIKKFRDWVMMNLEELAITNSSSGGVVFLLKNYGYTDKQEISYSKEIKPEIVVDDTGV